MYDDSNMRLLQLSSENRPYTDVREIMAVVNSVEASHDLEDRPGPDEIRANLQVDEGLCIGQKPRIILLDDVITAGAHFKACQALLQPYFPESSISGLFIARRAVRN